MKNIYLVRHCKATGQEPEASLTAEGKAQAIALVDFFRDKPVDYIVSSPYERAISTVQPLALHKNLTIQIDNRLSERVLSSEPLANWLSILEESFFNLDMKLEGGESSKEAMERGIDVIHTLISKLDKDNIVVASHGNLIALILKYIDNSFDFNDWKLLKNPDVFTIRVNKQANKLIVDHDY